MSRVFWDSMLFIYLVEDDPVYAPVVLDLLEQCTDRGDKLYTSHLSIAETLVGIPSGSGKEQMFLTTIRELEFMLVDFSEGAVESFRTLRRDFRLKPPDSMNLACAASLGVDLYLTNDEELLRKRLQVPGIQFIADFKHAPV